MIAIPTATTDMIDVSAMTDTNAGTTVAEAATIGQTDVTTAAMNVSATDATEISKFLSSQPLVSHTSGCLTAQAFLEKGSQPIHPNVSDLPDMMPQETQLDRESARLLMSLAIDGELPPEKAQQLTAYLESHPGELHWMENASRLSRERTPRIGEDEKAKAVSRIDQMLSSEKHDRKKVVPISRWIAPLSVAAAVTVVGSLFLKNETPSTPLAQNQEAAIVEFVATDIPDSSTFVYSDEESGWTVVWIEPFEDTSNERS